MRSGNHIFYLVIGITLAHFLLGFGWLLYKLTKKRDSGEEESTPDQE